MGNSVATEIPAPVGCAASTVLINAKDETVFAFLADAQQHQVIDGSGMLRGTIHSPQKLALGTKFGMNMNRGKAYTVDNVVTEYEENKLIAWRNKNGVTWRYTLEAEGDGVRVTEMYDIRTSPVKLVFRMMGVNKKFAPALSKTLATLKDLAEARQ